MKINHLIITTIAAALSLTPLYGAEEKKDEHKHEKGKHDDHAKKVEVKIPETAEALWAEIDTKWKALADLIAAKKSADLHVAAETVEALVSAVPMKHPDLAADKRKRVEGMVKNVARTLDAMHEEGEEGHWDDVAKKQAQIEAALKLIKQQVTK
jgi:hypothetical protein